MVSIAEDVPKEEYAHPLPPYAHLRSPSTSTVSSASWTDEPRQRALCKTASLPTPVPASPADAAALPRRGRLPQAQVFVSRPSTPNNLSRDLTQFARDRARLLAATRRERGSVPNRFSPRCTSDIAAVAASVMRRPVTRDPLRLTSSSTSTNTTNGSMIANSQLPTSPCTPRVCSPLPTCEDFEPLSNPEPLDDGVSSTWVGTPAPSFWRVAAHFECANLYDAPTAPTQTFIPTPAQAPQAVSTAHVSDSALSDHALSTPELVRVEIGSGVGANTIARNSTPPRVLSFDSYRLTKAKSDQHERKGYGLDDTRVDDYIGFMRVAPTRYESIRHKSRALIARLLGRRVEQTNTHASSSRIRPMRTIR